VGCSQWNNHTVAHQIELLIASSSINGDDLISFEQVPLRWQRHVGYYSFVRFPGQSGYVTKEECREQLTLNGWDDD
jgi:hypothetical protein